MAGDRSKRAAVLLAGALLLAACGDDGGGRTTAGTTTTAETAPTTSTTSTTEAATTTPPPPETTVAEETTTTAAPERLVPGPGLLTLEGPSPLRWGDDLDRARALTGAEPEPLCGFPDLSAGATLTSDGMTLLFGPDHELALYQVTSGSWTTPEGIGIGTEALEALDADARLADVGDTTALVRDGIPTDMLMTVGDGVVTEIIVSQKLDQEPAIGWC